MDLRHKSHNSHPLAFGHVFLLSLAYDTTLLPCACLQSVVASSSSTFHLPLASLGFAFCCCLCNPEKRETRKNKNNEALSENWSRNKENRTEKFRRSYCEQRQGLCCRSGSDEGSFVRRRLQRFMAATSFQSFFVVFSGNYGFSRKRNVLIDLELKNKKKFTNKDT